LAERLRAAGYSTAAATGGGYLHPRYGLFQGFDRYHSAVAGHLREDELTTSLSLVQEWLRDLPQPYFILLHTYDVHSPYRPRQPHLNRLYPDLPNLNGPQWLDPALPIPDSAFRVRRPGIYYTASRAGVRQAAPLAAVPVQLAIANYDSSVAYVDHHLGTLLDQVASQKQEHPTAVIFTSDHGEAFGEADHAGHGYLFENNLRVPLVIAWPDRRSAGTRVSRQVRSIDIMPTLLELAGVPGPTEIDGVSLTPLLSNPSAPFPAEAISWASNTNYGLSLRLGGRAKMTFVDAVWPPYHGNAQLFNLAVDPSESNDRSGLDSASLEGAMVRLREKFSLAAGIHLRFKASADVTAYVSGPGMTGMSVKSLDDCRCFAGTPAGGLRIRIDAGQTVEILLEGPAQRFLTTSFTTTEAAVQLSIDTTQLGATTLDICALSACPPNLPLRVTAKRIGPTSQPQGQQNDSELDQQLRALGYLQ
jgi:hypothetical protein